MKDDWLEATAYESRQSLRAHVEGMLRGFGQDFVINFASLLNAIFHDSDRLCAAIAGG